MGDPGNFLCQAIRAADEAARFRLDTFHRLVYADLLERRGDLPRALAVRLHAANEETLPGLVLPSAGPHPGRLETIQGWRHSLVPGHRRLTALWSRHRQAWRRQFPKPVRAGLGFRAGMPWCFSGLPEAWPRDAAGELSLVRSWILWAGPGGDCGLIRPGMLFGAWDVALAGPGWKGRVAHLLDTGAIPSDIRSFGVIDGALEPSEIRAILNREWPALAMFRASGNQLAAKGSAMVWKELAHTRVRELDLSRNNIGLATGFLCHGGPTGLRALHFGGNHTEARGTRAIAAAPFLERVTRVGWMGNSLGAKGAAALAAWRAPGLRALNLAANHLGPGGAGALARCPWFSGLSELDLSDNKLRDDGVGELAKALGAKTRALALEDNLLDPQAGGHLALSPAREFLAWLDLRQNRLGADGLARLSMAAWPRLRHAGLLMNDIPPEALFPRDRFPRLGRVRLARPGQRGEGTGGTRVTRPYDGTI